MGHLKMGHLLSLTVSRCRSLSLLTLLLTLVSVLVVTEPTALASTKRGLRVRGMNCNAVDTIIVANMGLLPQGGGGAMPQVGTGLMTRGGTALKADGITGLMRRDVPFTRLIQASTTQVRSVPFALNDNASHIDWMFDRTDGWWIAQGSQWHAGDDYYADDWNWGSTNDDEGLTVRSAFPGMVIFAGNNQVGYGNQVIVQSIDDPTFAIRYAHLYSVALETGDFVHFGSEIGTVGRTGGDYNAHLHSVLYKNIEQGNALDRLRSGYTPGGSLSGGPTNYAVPFTHDGDPVSGQCSEDLPCWTWNGDVEACDQHSILFGGQYTQDCAYYFCSGLCLPRGTSNCRAGCLEWCDGSLENDSDEFLPCHTWDGDLEACDDHSILFGNEYTRDCAYYIDSGKCRPRGTSNCLAGIRGHCGEFGCSH